MNVVFALIAVGHLLMDSIVGQSLPGKPTNIHVLADSFNIGVQWEPPSETFGAITNYVVSFTILPNTTEFFNIVSGEDNISIIAVGTHIGRLYKIRVSAQNHVGIGQYSDARYIRINCSDTFNIYPNTSIELSSPGYESGDVLEAGVICTWTLKTNPLYILEIKMMDIDIIKDKIEDSALENCSRSSAYVNVDGIGRFCDDSSAVKISGRSDLNILTVTLKTGRYAGGRGFKMKARSIQRLPGPPRNIRVATTSKAVIVTWLKPVENTLPVTSYIIRYNVINSRQLYRITISPNMRRFYLNAQRYKGQLLQVTVSAAIGFEEGKQSKSFFIRAPCLYKTTISAGQSVNISSPNYPNQYPPSIVCTWEVTSEPEIELDVTLIDFRLEDTSFCSNDYVLFTFKQNREPDCSRIQTPKTIQTKMSVFNFTFVTDEKNQFEGFLLEISSKGKQDRDSTVNFSTTTTTTFNDLYSTTTTTTSNDLSSINLDKQSRSTLVLTSTARVLTNLTSLSSLSAPSTVSPRTFTESSALESLSTKHNKPIVNAIYYNDGSETDNIHSFQITGSTDKTIKQTVSSDSSIARRKNETNTTFDKSEEFTARLDPSIASSIPKHVNERLEYITTTQMVDLDRASASIGGNLSDMTNTSREVDTINIGSSNVDTGTIVGCLTAALIVVVVCLGLYRYRKHKRKMKISYDGSVRYKRGHVELHDIINLPDMKMGRNNETFNVTKMQETSFINAPKVKNRKKSTQTNSNGKGSTRTSRRKHHSFPYSLGKRKVHQDVEKTLSAFKFIEDKETLKLHIQRKQCRNRTYSL